MESTLSLSLSGLEAEIGDFCGFGRGANYSETAWDTSQQARITYCLTEGLRQFYYPILDDGGQYDWSFLRPVLSVTYVDGASTVDLPDDFGGLEGNITLTSADVSTAVPVRLYNEGQVREAFAASPDAEGVPTMASLRPMRATDGAQGQRWQLYLFPIADADYTLQFQYYVLPDSLTTAYPFPLGGMAHVSTIIESCLAAAEQRLDDSMGVHTAKFKERLRASIAADRHHKAKTLGYNGDTSDQLARMNYRPWTQPEVTFDGVSYN